MQLSYHLLLETSFDHLSDLPSSGLETYTGLNSVPSKVLFPWDRTYLEISSLKHGQVKMRSHNMWMGLRTNMTDGCPYKEKNSLDSDPVGHKKMETEIRVMHLQAKGCHVLSANTRN